MARAELPLLETRGQERDGMWGSETARSTAGKEEESLPSFKALQTPHDLMISCKAQAAAAARLSYS